VHEYLKTESKSEQFKTNIKTYFEKDEEQDQTEHSIALSELLYIMHDSVVGCYETLINTIWPGGIEAIQLYETNSTNPDGTQLSGNDNLG